MQTQTRMEQAGTSWNTNAVILRFEGLAVLAAAAALYAERGASWWVFAALLLAPDLSVVGYAANKRSGALLYNIMHFYALPLGLGVAAYLLDHSTGLQLALIWLAHIGMDRMMGYGLKYPTDFKDTHLSRV